MQISGRQAGAALRRSRVVIAASCLVLLASFIWIAPSRWIQVPADDALFYPIIAGNTADGEAFSFDGGVSRTTGFHWLGMLVPLAVAYGMRLVGEPAAFPQAFPVQYAASALVLTAAAGLLAWGIASRSPRHRVVLSAFAVPVFGQTLLPGFGMESSYCTVAMAALILIVFSPGKRLIPLFVCAMLGSLARIDLAPLFIVLAFLLTMLRAEGFRTALRQSLYVLLGGLAALTCICLLNLLVTGCAIPTSVMVKGQGAIIDLAGFLRELGKRPFALIALAVSAAAGGFSKNRRFMLHDAFLLAALLGAVYASMVRSAGSNNIGSWYNVSWMTMLAMSLLLRLGDHEVHSRFRFLQVLVLVSAVIAFIPRDGIRLRLGMSTGSEAYYRILELFGNSVVDNTPPNCILAASDLPGRLTYFCGRHVIALDGLANSPEYVRSYLLAGRCAEYAVSRAGYLVILAPTLLAHGISDHPGQDSLTVALGFTLNPRIAHSTVRAARSSILAQFVDTLSGVEIVLLRPSDLSIL